MTDITPIHESKKHGTDNFAYSIYHSVIPINMVRYPLHWHDEVEIYYFRSGTALFTICNQKIVALPGDILIANSKYPHCAEQYRNSEADFFSVLFNPSLLVNQALDPGINQKIREIENGHSIVPHLIRRDTELNRKLTPYLLELIENQFRSYTDFQMGVIGCLFLIFQILIRYAVEADRNADEYRMDFSKVKPAIDAVINHYEQKISITTAAEKCCLSESHFMKIFKKITGKSFNEFLIEHRLNMASQMLKDTDDRLIDIANSSGFYNQSYFTRMFIRYYAMTPSEYRKFHQNATVPTDAGPAE